MKRSGANAHVLGICCFLCFCFASPGSILAQAAQEPGEAKTAPAVQLIISSKSAQFYAGGIIPLDLVVSSSSPQRSEINNARYARVGRMRSEPVLIVQT